MMKKPVLKLFTGLALAAAFVGGILWHISLPQAKPSDPSKIQIVTTTAQIGDMVRIIAGDTADVRFLMGEGVDPHLYRPTRTDIAQLKSADVVFYNGLHLEGQMVELLETLAKEKPVYAISDMLDKNSILNNANGHDPHIWMDVNNWVKAADSIKRILGANYPQHRRGYDERGALYSKSLMDLDGYVHRVFDSVPQNSRVLVTAHDAFGYLGNAYGIEVIGIQGISTESEAGLRRIEEIVTLLVERKIPAVFVETSVSERNVQALIEGAAAKGHKVEIGGTLFSDAMGAAGTYEGTYIGMMDYNATVISRALGGAAPETGMAELIQAVN